MSKQYPNVNLVNPVQFRSAVQNIHNVYNATPPDVRKSANNWYDSVHDAVQKGVKGKSTSAWQGAGLVAAVSPNMDWENHNIAAFGELHKLRESDWKQVLAGDRGPLQGMSISRAPSSGLHRAHRIMQGEDPDDVLPRRTAPKTNAFAHNIYQPQSRGPVTIDGRAHDVAANRLQPWEDDRGISSASLKTGKPTRYEHFEDAYRAASKSIAEQHGVEHLPQQIQAITWEGAKGLERGGTTKAGKPRKQGPARRGQPYV